MSDVMQRVWLSNQSRYEAQALRNAYFRVVDWEQYYRFLARGHQFNTPALPDDVAAVKTAHDKFAKFYASDPARAIVAEAAYRTVMKEIRGDE